MVNLGFSVLKSPRSGKDTKLDPPALKTPPLSPDDSESSPPAHVLVRNRVIDDNEFDERRIVPNDSLISELTYPQTPELSNSPQHHQLQQQDPPGAKVRFNKAELDVALRKYQGVPIKDDPPANQELSASLNQSIVTRVLGIVDIGCVSPFADRDNVAKSPPRLTHHKVEWGIAPSDTLLTGNEEIPSPNREINTKVNPVAKDYPISSLHLSENAGDVVVCVTPDENQQAHLQLQFPQPPSSPRRVSHPMLDNPPRLSNDKPIPVAGDSTNSKLDRGWITKRSTTKARTRDGSNKKDQLQPFQKVEAILGIVPFSDISDGGSEIHNKLATRRGIVERSTQEEKKEEERYLSPPKEKVRRGIANTASPRSKKDKIIVAPVIEPIEYRQTIQPTKPRPATPSVTAKFFRKAQNASPNHNKDGSLITDDNKRLHKLKVNGKKVIKVFQQIKKKDADNRTVDSTVSDPSPVVDRERRQPKTKQEDSTLSKIVSMQMARDVSPEHLEETETKFVPTMDSDDGSGAPRVRKVLKSIKSSSKAQLETVEEASEDEISCSTTSASEMRVRIPGIHHGAPDVYLSDKDLIGDEYVEEDATENQNDRIIVSNKSENSHSSSHQTVNISQEAEDDELIGSAQGENENHSESIVVNQQRMANNSATKDNESLVENKTPESESRSNFLVAARQQSLSPTIGIQKSWKDVLGFSSSIDSPKPPKSSERNIGFDHKNTRRNSLTRNNSAPQASKKADTIKPHKPMWKAVVDPKSGRAYYYHKETRETTWAKPPDHDIVSPKTKNKSKLASKNHGPQSQTQSTTTDSDLGKNQQKPKPGAMVTRSSKADKLDVVTTNNSPEKTREIAQLLSKEAIPSNAVSLERLVDRFGGREEDLVAKLRDLSESKPFDEPIPANASALALDDDRFADDDKTLQGLHGSIALSRTLASIHSGFSGNTRISDQTQQIRNTASGKPGFATIHEEKPSNDEQIATFRRRFPIQNNAPIPKNIPVPRSRELTVEEFTTRDPVFGVKDSDIQERKARGAHRQRRIDPTEPAANAATAASSYFSFDRAAYVGNVEECNEHDKDAGSYGPTVDSVSALSEADLSFITLQESLEMTRRRALHEALAQKDWDRAADISETMRMDRLRQVPDAVASPASIEWTQGPIDRFLCENDFDSVATYIAQMRAKAMKEERQQKLNKSRTYGKPQSEDLGAGAFRKSSTMPVRSNGNRASPYDKPTPAQKYNESQESQQRQTTRSRFGASSLLQHTKGANNSYSSYSSYSSNTSEENTSGSYFSEEEDEAVERLTSRVARTSGRGYTY